MSARNSQISHVSDKRGGGWQRTSRPPRAHSAIAGITRVATDVADPCIQQSLTAEVLAEEVLDAPEASCCYGTLLGVWREVFDRSLRVWIQGHSGGRREGSEEAGEEGGDVRGCHDEGDCGEERARLELNGCG